MVTATGSFDLVIRNGTIVGADRQRVADIAIADGRIVAIDEQLHGANTTIDALGLHLFPGLIDAHVHFNDPGRSEWEGFSTGSRAIAAGGGTLFLDMPLNAHPPTVDGPAFDAKLQAAAGVSLVDFALWGGLVPGNVDELEALAARGVVGFKAFMSNSGIVDFEAADDYTLYDGMCRAAQLEKIVAVHAENDSITADLARRAVAAGRLGAWDYLRSRPAIAEHEAIGRAIMFAEETACSLHIVHASTGRGVALVAEARARGVDVSCETCPHYLVFTEEDLERLGAVAKCAPPLRSASERDALWAHLASGALPIVASDHSPAPAVMKTGQDFFAIWGGISGCQSTLQLLLTHGYFERGLPLMSIAAATSTNVARRFGLARQKGTIAVGGDADLALVDLGADSMVEAENLFYKHAHSPYVGRRLRARIVRTLVRGTTVYAGGKVVSPPIGRLVKSSAMLRA
jgi:allantoinase